MMTTMTALERLGLTSDEAQEGWFADDGNAAVHYPLAESGYEAAKEYVDDGDWGDSGETTWVNVHVWQHDEDGERINEATHKIAINPTEPDCENGEEHDWRSPLSLVGGIKENPGVFGHGGGVISTEVCSHCGCYCVTDSWAQDREDGVQGLTSIEYREADTESLEWVEEMNEAADE